MILKVTVLALLTVSLLSNPIDQNDLLKLQSQMVEWNDENQKDDMYDMDHRNDPNNPHMRDPNYPYDDLSDDQLDAIILVYFILFVIFAAFNILLCAKCLKKRALSKGLQQQMRHKRIQFANLHGLDAQTLNDPRYSVTINV